MRLSAVFQVCINVYFYALTFESVKNAFQLFLTIHKKTMFGVYSMYGHMQISMYICTSLYGHVPTSRFLI
jgi:hypothetical protein